MTMFDSGKHKRDAKGRWAATAGGGEVGKAPSPRGVTDRDAIMTHHEGKARELADKVEKQLASARKTPERSATFLSGARRDTAAAVAHAEKAGNSEIAEKNAHRAIDAHDALHELDRREKLPSGERSRLEREEREAEAEKSKTPQRRSEEQAATVLGEHLGHLMPECRAQLMRDPDCDMILKSGVRTKVKWTQEYGTSRMASDQVVVRLGPDGECHWNTGKLFAKGEVDHVVIGYAKNTQGWHQHTWGLKGDKIVETTGSNVGNSEYHGLTLSKTQSQAFSEWTAANPPGRGMVRTSGNDGKVRS